MPRHSLKNSINKSARLIREYNVQLIVWFKLWLIDIINGKWTIYANVKLCHKSTNKFDISNNVKCLYRAKIIVWWCTANSVVPI